MKFPKYLLLLLTFVGIAVASSSCSKDDDDSYSDYQKTHAALSYEGSYVVYPRDSFHQYHFTDTTGEKKIVYTYNLTSNVTCYKADPRCYIIYYVSKEDGITDEMLNREIDNEAESFCQSNNYGVIGEQSTSYFAGLGKDVPTLTYLYNEAYYDGLPYKAVFYYMVNPNTGHAFRISVEGPASTTSFWNQIDDILSTFSFNG